MAWRNLESLVLNGNTYNLPLLSSAGISWVSSQTSGTTRDFDDDQCDSTNASGFFKITSMSDIAQYTNTDFYFNDTAYKFIYADFSSNPYVNTAIYFEKNNATVTYCNNATGTDKYPVLHGIIVNDETEKAIIWSFNEKANGFGSGYVLRCMENPEGSYTTELYNAIMGSQPVLYNWSSVPAISGKNGILSLPTLIDTDGEPISGQSASVFSSLPDGSNVRALINGAL